MKAVLITVSVGLAELSLPRNGIRQCLGNSFHEIFRHINRTILRRNKLLWVDFGRINQTEYRSVNKERSIFLNQIGGQSSVASLDFMHKPKIRAKAMALNRPRYASMQNAIAL